MHLHKLIVFAFYAVYNNYIVYIIVVYCTFHGWIKDTASALTSTGAFMHVLSIIAYCNREEAHLQGYAFVWYSGLTSMGVLRTVR